ncbi:MAG: MCP four helix bundle domain-containing protein [Candidatus Marinimicrobia bacterium]|nr:MCP four helix bundle domain-containing protein [Candidatus Neomarinimicrobiota bacterium]MCF7880481.1 MCP four helix bundle domain-containing protein [Candidatus Neomarinimicrobiota bacterium]
MNSGKGVKISVYLWGSVTVLLVLMLLIGGTGLLGLSDMGESLEDVTRDHLPMQNYLLQADRDLQQLLVAERSLFLVELNSRQFKEFFDTYEENMQQSKERMAAYSEFITTTKEQNLYDQYRQARKEWSSTSARVIRLAQTADSSQRAQALELSNGSGMEQFARMRSHIDELERVNEELITEAREFGERSSSRASLAINIVTLIALLSGMFIAWYMSRKITAPVIHSANTLKEGATQTVDAAEQFSQSSEILSEGATEQAASVEETSATLEQLTAMSRQMAENSDVIYKLMTSDAATNFQVISERMQDMKTALRKTVDASKKTGDVIRTIDEIAFQTNLLALNASVEAARAGAAGQGFSVVANEVRNLAQRAAEAARKTSDLIASANDRIEESASLNEQVEDALQKNEKIARKVTEMVDEVSTASREQSHGIKQISQAVNQVDAVAQQNAAEAEEAAAAAREMNSRAKDLSMVVEDLEILAYGSGTANGKSRDGMEKSNNGLSTADGKIRMRYSSGNKGERDWIDSTNGDSKQSAVSEDMFYSCEYVRR